MPAQPILIIEDEHALGAALSLVVRRIGHIPTLAASGTAGLDELTNHPFAAVILDIGLPDMSGLRVLEAMRAHDITTPVLVITAHATLDHAINAQKLGATEYMTKPLDLRQCEQAIGALLAKDMPIAAPPPPGDTPRAVTLIGAAACLRAVFVGIAKACAGDVPALIAGPGGSGKSLAAAVIHAHGHGSARPLATIECHLLADLAPLESLSAGTLVLEEITTLAPHLQSRLAAWLAAPPPGHPRILATTSADPREAVTAGTLRAELYYALSALTIPVPPLRDRTGDIPALAAFFIALRDDSMSPRITPPALAALQAYPWPGNVRELRHVIDCAVTLSHGGPIFLSHLPPHVAAASQSADAPPPSGELDTTLGRWLDAQLALPGDEPPSYDSLLDQVEAAMLRHLLIRHENKPTHLASALRIHRATLRQKLRRAGIQRPD